MKLRKPVRRVATIGAAAALVLAGSGLAWAAWTSSASGSAAAKAGTALQPTTSATAIVSGDTLLVPGGSGTLRITVNNPNPYSVKVTKVEPDTSRSVSATPVTGSTCTATGVTFTTQTLTTNNAVAAKSGSTDGSATFALPGVSMSPASDDGCQGATFSVPVTVTVASG